MQTFSCFGVPTPSVFPSCSGVFVNGTEELQEVVACIAGVRLSVSPFDGFLQPVCVGAVKQLSFSRKP